MKHRLRVWAFAGASALAPAFATAGDTPTLPPPTPLDPSQVLAPRACPSPSGGCAAPAAPRIVVEMSAPEVVFQRAKPTCVNAPSASGTGKQALYCYPLPPAAPQPGYAPAPTFMPYPAPVMTYSMPGPALVPPFAPAAYPVAPPPAFAPAPAAFAPAPVPCGSSGFGAAGLAPHAGLGPTAADLEAMAAEKRALEETMLKLHLGDLQKRYNALAGQAAAMGLSPPPLSAPSAAPRDTRKPAAPTPSASPMAADDPVLKEIAELRAEIDKLWTICAMHHGVLKERGLIPPAK